MVNLEKIVENCEILGKITVLNHEIFGIMMQNREILGIFIKNNFEDFGKSCIFVLEISN